MILSPAMNRWVEERVAEARAILASPRSTDSQRSVARFVLVTWSAP
ncbi:hypothetical protein [Paramagnetospirillum marisnigri]|nr:hypothetical protein [Paramagnetospirillum marisnigri]